MRHKADRKFSHEKVYLHSPRSHRASVNQVEKHKSPARLSLLSPKIDSQVVRQQPLTSVNLTKSAAIVSKKRFSDANPFAFKQAKALPVSEQPPWMQNQPRRFDNIANEKLSAQQTFAPPSQNTSHYADLYPQHGP